MRLETGDPLIVVIADGDAVGPAGIADAGFAGNVGEGAVVVVVEEGAAGLDSLLRHVDGLGVGEVDVGPAVAVIVDEGDAAAHGFDDEFLFGAGVVVEANAGGGSDVDELGVVEGRRRLREGREGAGDPERRGHEDDEKGGERREAARSA